MSKPLISIIVPVYNAAKYLGQCLDSILAQTYSILEVILVDDGSSDNSYQIYEEYAGRDSRFSIYRKPNGGVSSARNVGLAHAKGKYVMFVDSDDRLPEDALQNHLNHFSEDVDMTMGSFLTFSDEEPEIFRVEVAKSEIVSRDKCLFDFTPNGEPEWQRDLWNRMYRLSVVRDNNLKFNEKIAYKEDGLFVVQYLLRSKGNVAYIPDIVYYYRQNPVSAMGGLKSGQTSKLTTDIDAHALIIKEMRRASVAEEILDKEVAHALSSRQWVFDFLKNSGTYSRRIWLETLVKILAAVGIKRSLQIISETISHRMKVFFRKNEIR